MTLAFAITAAQDGVTDNIVVFSYSGLTFDYGTIDFNDGQVSKVFPSRGSVAHTYSAAGSYTVTVNDPDDNLLDDVAVTVTLAPTPPTSDRVERDSVVVQPTTSLGTDGAFEGELTTSTQHVLQGRVAADTANRVQLNAAGKMEWGSGSGVVDTNLYRYAADGLATDDALKLAAAAILLFGAAGDTNLYRSAADVLATDDDLSLKTAGKGLQFKEGSNARMGTATLVAGEAVVANTSVTADTRILLTTQSLGTVTASMPVAVTARTAATSFTITSSDATDTSVVAYLLMEPAA